MCNLYESIAWLYLKVPVFNISWVINGLNILYALTIWVSQGSNQKKIRNHDKPLKRFNADL